MVTYVSTYLLMYLPSFYLDQRLPQHENLYPIGLKSTRIEIPNGGSHLIDFSKTDFKSTKIALQ